MALIYHEICIDRAKERKHSKMSRETPHNHTTHKDYRTIKSPQTHIINTLIHCTSSISLPNMSLSGPTALPQEQAQSPTLPPLTTLPTELVLLLFKYLSNRDIDALMSVPELSRHYNGLFRLITVRSPEDSYLSHLTQRTDLNDTRALCLQSRPMERIIVEMKHLNYLNIDRIESLAEWISQPLHLSHFATEVPRNKATNRAFDLPYKTITFERLTELHLTGRKINPTKHRFPSLKYATFVDCPLDSKSPSVLLDAPLLCSLTLKGSSHSLLDSFDLSRCSISTLTLCESTMLQRLDGLKCPTLDTLNIINCNLSLCNGFDLEAVHEITIKTDSSQSFELANINAPKLDSLFIYTASAQLSIHDLNAPALTKISLTMADLTECYNVHTPSLNEAVLHNKQKELNHTPSETMDLTCFKEITKLESLQASGIICNVLHLLSLTLESPPPDQDLYDTPFLRVLVMKYNCNISTLPFKSLKEVTFVHLTTDSTSLDTEALTRTFPMLLVMHLETTQNITITDLKHPLLMDVNVLCKGKHVDMLRCSLPMLTRLDLATMRPGIHEVLPNCVVDLEAPLLHTYKITNARMDSVDLTKFTNLAHVGVIGTHLKNLVLNSEHLKTLDISNNRDGVDLIVSKCPLNALTEVVNDGTPMIGWEPLDCLLLSPVLDCDSKKQLMYVSGYVPKRGVKRVHGDEV